ncbi:DUF1697 domain-containing protein [Altibacter sp. HG106]|uniref:DUF1697 domain-containing protein n=1 Tax=Altibacter sp. HG106 TaxID=3023937 RepID=UPI0023507E41|nr:DUF1697 domain-containing protein [Altibacter sp. HG106]MDC7994914.1 DUF1697 domain-containing protein [Altibacter sp. HG106]
MHRSVLFLRGINVGGHHKVPMADLRTELITLGGEQVATVLNSGNVLVAMPKKLDEQTLSNHLKTVFGFSIPTMIRPFEAIKQHYEQDPFREVVLTKQIRRYITFQKEFRQPNITLPWKSEDGSFRILQQKASDVFSVLDLSRASTPKAMDVLEQFYGTEVTTRNWNTIEKIMIKAEKLGWR